MSDVANFKALKRIREAIANGRELSFYDDTTPGDKSSACSWGACSEVESDWDKDCRRESGRVMYRSLPCPMDRRTQEWMEDTTKTRPTWSCFYNCRVFSPLERGVRPSRDEAVALFDGFISRLESEVTP